MIPLLGDSGVAVMRSSGRGKRAATARSHDFAVPARRLREKEPRLKAGWICGGGSFPICCERGGRRRQRGPHAGRSQMPCSRGTRVVKSPACLFSPWYFLAGRFGWCAAWRSCSASRRGLRRRRSSFPRLEGRSARAAAVAGARAGRCLAGGPLACGAAHHLRRLGAHLSHGEGPGAAAAVCGMEGGVNQHRFISLSRNDLCGSWDNEWGQSTAQRLSGCHTADAGPKGS